MIVRANTIATIVFTVTAVYAAVVFSTTAQWIGAAVAMACFIAGIAAFVWSFLLAVQRSREEQVAVVQLYLLAGGVAPRDVRRTMWLLLLVQVAVGLATAIGRANDTDGSPGTSLALGVLVPVLGLGLNGLWAALHGTYAARVNDETPPGSDTSDAPIDQNGHHG